MKNPFIVIDGVAGSGKSTMIRAIKAWAEKSSYRIFDLADWSKKHRDPPLFEEVSDYDIYFLFEPTKQWAGAAIRYELSKNDDPYPAKILADAFAIDRMIQYKRLVAPAREANKIVIQDRSVSSSIAYQPVLDKTLTVETITSLLGNEFALKHAPDHLILTSIPPEKVRDRLLDRDDDSKGIFENIELLKKVSNVFSSDWFHELFQQHGTKIHTFDTTIPKTKMEQNTLILIKSLLNQS